MNRQRHHPLRGEIAAVSSDFWREAVGPGLQIASNIDRISRLRRPPAR